MKTTRVLGAGFVTVGLVILAAALLIAIEIGLGVWSLSNLQFALVIIGILTATCFVMAGTSILKALRPRNNHA